MKHETCGTYPRGPEVHQALGEEPCVRCRVVQDVGLIRRLFDATGLLSPSYKVVNTLGSLVARDGWYRRVKKTPKELKSSGGQVRWLSLPRLKTYGVDKETAQPGEGTGLVPDRHEFQSLTQGICMSNILSNKPQRRYHEWVWSDQGPKAERFKNQVCGACPIETDCRRQAIERQQTTGQTVWGGMDSPTLYSLRNRIARGLDGTSDLAPYKMSEDIRNREGAEKNLPLPYFPEIPDM